ncbi:MAG: N-acetylmuramoyl-L-alanine amidase [Bifidobacteriaceae bacterium]|nr:N-acetylmuramoyl-L-alanine amidase [Bifidobacteriaceae bacterium]
MEQLPMRAIGALAAASTLAAASALGVAGAQGSETSAGRGWGDEAGAGIVRSEALGRPLQGWVIALDPGHSGGNTARLGRSVPDGRGGSKACNTSGTATAEGYAEHSFNFDVARRTAKLLRAKGAVVKLTRSDDRAPGPCVDRRGTFAQRAHADAMVSIHGDGSIDTSLRGYHAIVSSPPLNEAQGAPSVALAKAIMRELAGLGFVRNPNYAGGLSKRADIAGVNLTERPTVMMELGEMRNPAEAGTMSSSRGRQRYAQAIARGIVAWAAGQKPGTWDDVGKDRKA